MIQDLVENLERTWGAVNAEKCTDFVLNTYRFREQLLQDSRTAAILEDLRREESDSVKLLNAAHREISRTLTPILDALQQTASEAFDPPPEDREDRDTSAQGIRWLLEKSDRVVADPYAIGKERTDSDELSEVIAILLAISDRAQRPEIRLQLEQAQRQLDHSHRTRRIFHMTSAGSSLVTVERQLDDLHPAPIDSGLNAELARMARTKGTRLGGLGEAMFGRVPQAPDDPHLDALVEDLRSDVKRVYEDVRRRIGAERSLLAVVERYRQRCQWYDAERLREVAAAKKGKAEDRLADTLAIYLFDHGLNPLTQPLAGQIRPDLLDAHTRFSFYVEAKQYQKAASGYLLKGMQQVWDMLDQLQGSGFDVREAFYVIYRRGGPRYSFHSRVQHRDRVVHILVVDIAPTSERGSKAPATRTFSLEELLPQPANLPSKTKRAPKTKSASKSKPAPKSSSAGR